MTFQPPRPIPDTQDVEARHFDDISEIDALQNYSDFNPLPPSERTRILNRQGTTLSEADAASVSGSGRKIVAALDFRYDEHVNAVNTQAKAAAKSGDTVVLFNVLGKSSDTAGLQEMRSNSDARLAQISKISNDYPEGVEVLTHLVHGRPEKELLKCVATHHANLIILGKRNLSTLKKIASTSVSDTIIKNANCSVLIARP